jgi:hypothetical protein
MKFNAVPIASTPLAQRVFTLELGPLAPSIIPITMAPPLGLALVIKRGSALLGPLLLINSCCFTIYSLPTIAATLTPTLSGHS